MHIWSLFSSPTCCSLQLKHTSSPTGPCRHSLLLLIWPQLNVPAPCMNEKQYLFCKISHLTLARLWIPRYHINEEAAIHLSHLLHSAISHLLRAEMTAKIILYCSEDRADQINLTSNLKCNLGFDKNIFNRSRSLVCCFQLFAAVCLQNQTTEAFVHWCIIMWWRSPICDCLGHCGVWCDEGVSIWNCPVSER